MRGVIYQWLDERLSLTSLIALARKKVVPLHRHTFWYYWGGLSLFFFIVQLVTGVLLLVYYRPGVEAYESVRRITYEVAFGWLIRSTHSWAANLMIFCVMVHMFSTFFMKAYQKPREINWWSGLVLLGISLSFGFTGYLLPMDELAYFATRVGLEIIELIPGLGPPIAALLRGGPDVCENTVQRFFAIHVVVLPFLFMPVLIFHLWLVQKHGNALPPSELERPEFERRSVPFFPNFMLRDLIMWLLAFNLLAVLAVLFPWQLGQQADPLQPAPAGIHPEWYFMSSFHVLKILGALFPGATGEIVGLVLFTAGMLLWALVPLYDNRGQFGRRARTATCLGLIVVILLITTTIWGYTALK